MIMVAAGRGASSALGGRASCLYYGVGTGKRRQCFPARTTIEAATRTSRNRRGVAPPAKALAKLVRILAPSA